MKKLISFSLALCMTLLVFQVSAFAQDAPLPEEPAPLAAVQDVLEATPEEEVAQEPQDAAWDAVELTPEQQAVYDALTDSVVNKDTFVKERGDRGDPMSAFFYNQINFVPFWNSDIKVVGIQVVEFARGNDANILVNMEAPYAEKPQAHEQWIIFKFYVEYLEGQGELRGSQLIPYFANDTFVSRVTGAAITPRDTQGYWFNSWKGKGIDDLVLYEGGSAYAYLGVLVDKQHGMPNIRIPYRKFANNVNDQAIWLDTDWDRIMQISGFVERMYTKVLNRAVDNEGLNYWTHSLFLKERTGAEVAKEFVLSEEYKNKGKNQTEFLTDLYRAFFDREPDPEGIAYWQREHFAKGVTRAKVMRAFILSEEFANICASYGIERGDINVDNEKDPIDPTGVRNFIERIYTEALGRTGDAEGIAYWTAEIVNGRKQPIEAAKAFVLSPEFEKKGLNNTAFIQVMYDTFFGRTFDQEGLNYWLGRMQSGASRAEILDHFASSEEFKKIMAAYGLFL